MAGEIHAPREARRTRHAWGSLRATSPPSLARRVYFAPSATFRHSQAMLIVDVNFFFFVPVKIPIETHGA